jgi:carboxymethylenebutenolidase
MKYEGMLAETVLIQGHNGDQIDAYLARPLGPGPHPSVVLIHHMPGWDEASKEMARKLAYNGIATISPNLHFREGKSTPQENSASVRDAGGMPDDRTLGDVGGSMAYLRSLPYCNGKVGIIGFCSGGRQVYLAACRLPGIDAAVDCYGGDVVAAPGALNGRQPVAPIDYTADLGCPLLGLFGEEDDSPSPEDVAKTEAELKRHGKTYEFHMYQNAGHGFFAVDRPSYRQHTAIDAWPKVLAWYNKYLSTDASGAGAGTGKARAAVSAGDA